MAGEIHGGLEWRLLAQHSAGEACAIRRSRTIRLWCRDLGVLPLRGDRRRLTELHLYYPHRMMNYGAAKKRNLADEWIWKPQNQKGETAVSSSGSMALAFNHIIC